MKLTLAQMRVQTGHFQTNFETMQRWIKDVQEETDLIIFPELALSGVFLGDDLHRQEIIQDLLAYNEKLKALSQDIGIIWGNIYEEEGKLYNAAYFAYQGEWVEHTSGQDAGFYLKHILEASGIYDEKRSFTSGYGEFTPFMFKEQRIGVQIHQDTLNDDPYFSVTEHMMAEEADMLITIAARPWVHDRSDHFTILKDHLVDVPFIYVNAVGIQNTGKNVTILDGASGVVHGNHVYRLNDDFKSDIETINLEHVESYSSLVPHKLYEALLHGLRYYDEEIFPYQPKWVVGISGGLDSSVSTALLVIALGKERVVGINMPSQHNQAITKDNAKMLAERLNIVYHELPIEAMVKSTVKTLNEGGYSQVGGLAYENIQARLRGHLLMSVASLEDGVVINNGNKIETALGYATLYGDAIGAFAVLADLTKLEVGQIAETINEALGQEIVPKNLIPHVTEGKVIWEFAPSAELADEQKDPMKWGYHDYLITYLMRNSVLDLMKFYQSGTLFKTDVGIMMKEYGLDDPQMFIADLEWVLKAIHRNVYKRIQAPPVLKVSQAAFGSDVHEVQYAYLETESYQKLKAEILKE